MSTKWIVAVYRVDLAYGGPEEGGWWFPCGELVRISRVFGSEDLAESYSGRMNRKLNALVNKHRPSISSVSSEGQFQASVYEEKPVEYWPPQRPHYE